MSLLDKRFFGKLSSRLSELVSPSAGRYDFAVGSVNKYLCTVKHFSGAGVANLFALPSRITNVPRLIIVYVKPEFIGVDVKTIMSAFCPTLKSCEFHRFDLLVG